MQGKDRVSLLSSLILGLRRQLARRRRGTERGVLASTHIGEQVLRSNNRENKKQDIVNERAADQQCIVVDTPALRAQTHTCALLLLRWRRMAAANAPDRPASAVPAPISGTAAARGVAESTAAGEMPLALPLSDDDDEGDSDDDGRGWLGGGGAGPPALGDAIFLSEASSAAGVTMGASGLAAAAEVAL